MRHRSSLLHVHAAVVLFGLAGLFGKWLILAPVFIVLGRVLFGSLALAFDSSPSTSWTGNYGFKQRPSSLEKGFSLTSTMQRGDISITFSSNY